eukprot:TRINITY_DN1981_c0_g3_i1.p1 TRINITY_DN1981_c0_g3~~TRINITY_DN1981_c0_g3_i1.p1  ORF type:complete len:506 (+),score=59.74 TRINITY_DN1981_c0_g3_i1:658-2175(+)
MAGRAVQPEDEIDVDPIEEALEECRDAMEAASTERCSVWRDPGRVLVYSSISITSQAGALLRKAVTHPAFIKIAIPSFLFYAYTLYILEGPHREYLYSFNRAVQDGLFWIILGIASSVGFGSGMHSGILFLFPHIYKVCMAADDCGNLDFGTNVLLSGGPASMLSVLPIGDRSNLPAYCVCTKTPDTVVPFTARLAAVALPCMLWGAGTAVGEIPPYFVAYKSAGVQGTKKCALQKEMGGSTAPIEAMKEWMVDIVKRHGFAAVFLLSAWPNAFFDLCGLCCGAIRMPFLTFFSAVLLGKAVVKVGGQCVFFVSVFTKTTFVVLIDSITATLLYLFPGETGEGYSTYVRESIDKQLLQFQDGHHETKDISLMNIIVLAVVAQFLTSALEQFAMDFEREQDAVHIETLIKKRDQNKNKDPSTWIKPRVDRGLPYSRIIAVIVASIISFFYLSATAVLTYVVPLGMLIIVSVFIEPKKLTTPLDSLFEYPLLLYVAACFVVIAAVSW